MPRFWGLDGVLYSMPVSDILTFVIAVAIIAQSYQALISAGLRKATGKDLQS